jgi:hypothetical protein
VTDSAGNSPQPSQQSIPLALEIGWTMAVLYGVAGPQPAGNRPPPTGLPTEHELDPANRTALEQDRVNALLARLKGLVPDTGNKVQTIALNTSADDAQTGEAGADAKAPNDNQKSLTASNLTILEWLACAGRDFGLAYQLGRSLRDTSSPGEGLVTQLSRSRVSIIQEWLSTLQTWLPGDAAAIVSVSVGRWSDFVSTIFDPSTPGGLRRGQSQADATAAVTSSLLAQGDAWIDLLTGAESSQKLLTPEGYVATGEAALGRTARIVRRIVAHYWYVLVILAAALGAVLYFAASGIGGAGRAWTQIAAVASALGITWKGIATAVARFSEQAEQPIYDLEKIDALAWAVTTFPASVKVDRAGGKALRRSGIVPPGPMGGR